MVGFDINGPGSGVQFNNSPGLVFQSMLIYTVSWESQARKIDIKPKKFYIIVS